MDWSDAEAENAYLEQLEDLRDTIHEEFRSERLRSYYLAQPDIALAPVEMLREARAVAAVSPSAAYLLAFAAAEVGVKQLLMRPLLAGLTHTDAVGPLLAAAVFQQRVLEKLKPLLFDLLRRFGDVDLETHTRLGADETLWKEILGASQLRNGIVHRCEAVTMVEAHDMINIAAEVLTRMFPWVVRAVGLYLHDGYRIGDHEPLSPELQAMLDRIQA